MERRSRAFDARGDQFGDYSPNNGQPFAGAKAVANLQCGRHHETLGPAQFRACRHGITFRCPWALRVGTEVAMELLFENPFDPDCPPEPIDVRGIVIESGIVPETSGLRQVSMVFLDLPCATRARIEELAARFTSHAG